MLLATPLVEQNFQANVELRTMSMVILGKVTLLQSHSQRNEAQSNEQDLSLDLLLCREAWCCAISLGGTIMAVLRKLHLLSIGQLNELREADQYERPPTCGCISRKPISALFVTKCRDST